MDKFTSVCFIGDSITAAEKYTRILVDYFVLHFPEKKILFHNVSIPGIGAGLFLQNWDALITSRKPTHAVVMFGMNDLQPSLYADSAKITDSLLAKRENAFDVYKKNMQEVLSRLKDVSTLVMTPTVHDESPSISAPLYGGYDAMLKRAGGYLLETFPSVLDLHTPLSLANSKGLVQTVIGPDRVHPGNIGHAIIAYTILKHLGFENPRLPLWDESITAEEKSVLEKLGIFEDTAPKNPYSDARSAAARRLALLYYVEMNVLAGQGIDKTDGKKVDEYLTAQLTKPIEEWRIETYKDYMKNRERIPQFEEEVLEAMKKMYR